MTRHFTGMLQAKQRQQHFTMRPDDSKTAAAGACRRELWHTRSALMEKLVHTADWW